MSTFEFSIAPQTIGSFNYLGRKVLIWASTRNAALPPNQWQFRYAPLLIPAVTTSGELHLDYKRLPSGAFRVFLPIRLFTEEADQLAFEAIRCVYPMQADLITPGNVMVLPLRTIRFSLADLTEFLPNAKLHESLNLFSTDKEILLSIDLPGESALADVKIYLAAANLGYSIGFDAKTTRQNAVTVRYQDLKNSNMFVQLDGKGSNEVYVHRDDLRRLTEGLSRTIQTVGVIEEPARFDQDIFAKILATLSQGLSSSGFDEQKWRSTYNGDDLKPDMLTRTLNKMFSKDDNEERWKYHADAEFSTKADLFGIISGEAKVKGSYDNEGLSHTLAERGIEAQFEGSKIIAKSLNLLQVNLGQFSVDGVFTSIVTYVENNGQEQKGTISLAALSPTDWTPDFHARLNALEVAAKRPVEVLEMRASGIQRGFKDRDTIYSALEITLTPGTWHVFGSATLFIEEVPCDDCALGLYNATRGEDFPTSTGAIVVIENHHPTAVATAKVVEVKEPTQVRLKAFRNGNSVVSFGNFADGIRTLCPQRLYALRLR